MGGLPPITTKMILYEHFSKFGAVEETIIMLDRDQSKYILSSLEVGY